MKKVSIIIPNYNGEELLRKNLPKVLDVANFYLNQYQEEVEVLIVDDCSRDNSVKEIQNYGLKVKIIQNEKNLGFSLTVNRGVEEASGEIIILLNTDIAPEKNFLEPLLPHFKDPKVFAVGCLDKSIEGKRVVLRGRGVGEWKRGFFVHSRGEVNKTDTLWVSGGSGAFKKDLWQKLGGFDKLYKPFYWEDIDLSYRALKSGYKIYFEPESRVFHYHEEGIIKKNYAKSRIKIIAYRNQFIFIWKNITDLDKKLSHLFWLPYHFIKAILRGDLYFLIAFFLALLKLPFIIRESFKIRKLFTKSDREIIG